jgi:hypothetical protein
MKEMFWNVFLSIRKMAGHNLFSCRFDMNETMSPTSVPLRDPSKPSTDKVARNQIKTFRCNYCCSTFHTLRSLNSHYHYVRDCECELKCGLLRALNSNVVSFSILRYLHADLSFVAHSLTLWEKKRAQNLLKNNSSLAKNMGQARGQPRDGPSTAKKWEDFSETKKIDSTTAEQLNILQRNS